MKHWTKSQHQHRSAKHILVMQRERPRRERKGHERLERSGDEARAVSSFIAERG